MSSIPRRNFEYFKSVSLELMGSESIGGNAGENSLAINFYFDAQGVIRYFGNKIPFNQDELDDFNEGALIFVIDRRSRHTKLDRIIVKKGSPHEDVQNVLEKTGKMIRHFLANRKKQRPG